MFTGTVHLAPREANSLHLTGGRGCRAPARGGAGNLKRGGTMKPYPGLGKEATPLGVAGAAGRRCVLHPSTSAGPPRPSPGTTVPALPPGSTRALSATALTD